MESILLFANTLCMVISPTSTFYISINYSITGIQVQKGKEMEYGGENMSSAITDCVYYDLIDHVHPHK